jgi:hypothetical protein
MQTNKLPYAGAGSEIDSRGHKNIHWQIARGTQIHNINLSRQFTCILTYIMLYCLRV